MNFKVIMSITFLGLFIIRMYRPDLNIDNISVILMIMVFLPWFFQYIKSLEIYGIGKVELIAERKKEEIQIKAKEAGITKEKPVNINKSKYSFYKLRYEDSKLALAGLRIELESILSEILEQNGIKTTQISVKRITNILMKKKLITKKESIVIYEIIDILNKAVHGGPGSYDSETFDWVFDLGLNLLDSLSQKLL